MARQVVGCVIFGLGVCLLFIHTTLPAAWELFGPMAPYPLSSTTGLGALASGFTPPLGAVLTVIAAVVVGPRRTSEGA